jgi:hypothetical protein
VQRLKQSGRIAGARRDIAGRRRWETWRQHRAGCPCLCSVLNLEDNGKVDPDFYGFAIMERRFELHLPPNFERRHIEGTVATGALDSATLNFALLVNDGPRRKGNGRQRELRLVINDADPSGIQRNPNLPRRR